MSQVEETVTLDQLRNNSGNYLNSTIDKPKNFVNPPSTGIEPDLEKLIQEVKNQIIGLDYRDIDFLFVGTEGSLHLETYAIILPDEIQDKVDEIRYKIAGNSWFFEINSEGEGYFNRTHFNNGLPYELRGTGFGFKIYKAFITIKGYASSNAINSSEDAQRVWIKLVQECHFECIINNRVVLVLNNKLHNKLLIAKQFIEFNTIHINSSNTIISETLLNEIKPCIPVALGGSSNDTHDITTYPTANENLKKGETVWIFDLDNNLILNNEKLARKLGATLWKKGVNDLQDYDAVVIINLTFNQGENVALVYSPRTKKEYLVNVEGLEKEHAKDFAMN